MSQYENIKTEEKKKSKGSKGMVYIALGQCVWLGDVWHYIAIILLLRVAALHVYSYCNKWVKLVHVCDLCNLSE